MLEFLKNYYVFMLILLLFSYLVPKEEYKRYIQFFIGIFVVVLFLRPILEFSINDNENLLHEVFIKFNQGVLNLDMEIEEGENMFEYFFLERKGE